MKAGDDKGGRIRTRRNRQLRGGRFYEDPASHPLLLGKWGSQDKRFKWEGVEFSFFNLFLVRNASKYLSNYFPNQQDYTG